MLRDSKLASKNSALRMQVDDIAVTVSQGRLNFDLCYVSFVELCPIVCMCRLWRCSCNSVIMHDMVGCMW